MDIRIAGTVEDSIVDGPGLRFVVFVQGCPHHCEGCHNPETHDFSAGKLTTTDALYEMCMENPLCSGVTFSGGEPFCQPEALYELGSRFKAAGKIVRFGIVTSLAVMGAALHENDKTNPGPVHNGFPDDSCQPNGV